MIKFSIAIARFLYLLISVLVISSCSGRRSDNPRLIITEAPGNTGLSPDYSNGAAWRYLPGARISAIKLNKPGSRVVLTGDFHSACSPDIAPDGKTMLFAGRKAELDPWQIWEMDLKNCKYRQVTNSMENCTDPVYLPGDRLAFTRQIVNDTVKSSNSLYTCKLDGSGLKQITFSPQSFFALTVLKDGRLICIGTQTYPEKGEPAIMVMRPDGTKADMFYRNLTGHSRPLGRISETDDGLIIFAEYDEDDKQGGEIISVNYSRPLFTRDNLTSGIAGDFIAATPLTKNELLVSYREPGKGRFAIYTFKPSEKSVGEIKFSDADHDIIDISIARPFQRPKNLPSEVDLLVKSGLILCQDVNFRENLTMPENKIYRRADKIEILGVDSTYGIVPVEEDGSFYLRVLADKPFRITALDENGDIVGKPGAWLYLRPNERRGCVGCHEDPEFAPENRVSLAIKKNPVIIPVHVTEIIEKIVELE